MAIVKSGGQIASAANTNALYNWTSPSATTVNKTADGLNRDASIAAVGGPPGRFGIRL